MVDTQGYQQYIPKGDDYSSSTTALRSAEKIWDFNAHTLRAARSFLMQEVLLAPVFPAVYEVYQEQPVIKARAHQCKVLYPTQL